MKSRNSTIKKAMAKKHLEAIEKAIMSESPFAEESAAMADRRHSSRRAPSTILETAQSLIYGARNKTYKHPTENFDNIANLWNAYFQAISSRPDVFTEHTDGNGNYQYMFHVNKIDVAYMNILQKIARGATNQEHEDTIVDIAGYAGCIERIVKNK